MVDFNEGRQRAANYIGICNNIADSYPNGVPHGLQKDAIQNSIDARKGRRIVQIKFELVRNNKGTFFVITDSNTTGLTGPVVHDVSDYEEELPVDYHWARFESFAFTKDNPNAIGARGQGKFIFLRSSNQYTMYYDTLLEDGLYRLGGTKATQTGCPILPSKCMPQWENEIGIEKLMRETGLKPPEKIGTRIIIVDPIDELVEQLGTDEFKKAIQETWARLLEKGLVDISIILDNIIEKIELPDLYPLKDKDTKKCKTWILGQDFDNNKISISTGESFKIKHFHAVYLKNEDIPEQFQGISIIHNGMKITSIDMMSAPLNIREKICGYIEFEKPLDQALRLGENQNPNHYNLKWRMRIPKAIKEFINNQLRAFGEEKLGLGVDPREIRNRRLTNAEEWAMRQFMKYAQEIDLFGGRGFTRKNIDTPPPPIKKIGISINGFVFPDTDIAPRINHGQKFTNIKITAYNHQDHNRSVDILVQVLHGSASIIKVFDRLSINLSKHSSQSTKEFEIDINKTNFKIPGRYRLKATLIDSTSGDKIDSVARRFWVEKNPPLKQPFNLESARNFPEPFQFRQWYASGSINNSPTLYYNMDHPGYKLAESNQDLLNDYMFQIILDGAVHFVLDRPNKVDGSPDFHPLDVEQILGDRMNIAPEDIPLKTHEEINRFISEIRWRYLIAEV
jgi:hypothetical protein